MPAAERHEEWHLDKKIPIAIIVAIAVQSAAGIWWASETSSNVKNLYDSIGRLESRVEGAASENAARDTRLRAVEQAAERIDANLQAITRNTDRLLAQMDRLLEDKASE